MMAKTMMLTVWIALKAARGIEVKRSEDMQEMGERCSFIFPSSSRRSCLAMSPGESAKTMRMVEVAVTIVAVVALER